MTREEFGNEYVFHSTREYLLDKIRNEGLEEGQWFARTPRESTAFNKSGASRSAQLSQPTFGVRRSEIDNIPPSPDDPHGPFAEEFWKAGIYLRSGKPHKPDFEIPGAWNTDPHKYLVQQALSEGKPVPPEVLADYPDLAKPTGEGAVSDQGSLSWQYRARNDRYKATPKKTIETEGVIFVYR